MRNILGYNLSVPLCYLFHNIANWFNNAASFYCATCNTRQQRSECKIIARWYHLNVIRWIIQILQKTGSSPTSSKYQHPLFLVIIFGGTKTLYTWGWFWLGISYKPSTTARRKQAADKSQQKWIWERSSHTGLWNSWEIQERKKKKKQE